MSHHPDASRYASVLLQRGIPRAFAFAALARLSYAAVGLALLLAVTSDTDSYAIAAASIGAYGLASFTMPVKSRVVDRHGPRRAVPPMAAGYAACLIGITVLATADIHSGASYIALAACAGLFAPPIGPTMRAMWAAVTPEPDARRRAYSLDSAVEEVLFAIGPMLVGGLVLLAPEPVAVASTAVLGLAGSIGLARSPLSAPPASSATLEHGADRHWTGPLKRPGFALLLAVLFGVGLGGGPLEVSVVARAERVGSAGLVGVLLAAVSAGSAVGGLLWGRVVRTHSPRTQLAALAAASTLVGAALVPTTDLLLLGVLLFVAGLMSSPLLIVGYLTADTLVDTDQQHEASTWVNTATNLGVASGAAAAGLLIDRHGPDLALAAGAIAFLVVTMPIGLSGRRLAPPTSSGA